jgi:hypothetical protein
LGDLFSGALPPDPVKFSRFTDRAKRAVVAAVQEEAIKRRHDRVLPEHLALGLLHEQEGLAARAIVAIGVSPEGTGWLVPVLEQMAAAKGQGS